jgi:hypothetical protein
MGVLGRKMLAVNSSMRELTTDRNVGVRPVRKVQM